MLEKMPTIIAYALAIAGGTFVWQWVMHGNSHVLLYGGLLIFMSGILLSRINRHK